MAHIKSTRWLNMGIVKSRYLLIFVIKDSPHYGLATPYGIMDLSSVSPLVQVKAGAYSVNFGTAHWVCGESHVCMRMEFESKYIDFSFEIKWLITSGLEEISAY